MATVKRTGKSGWLIYSTLTNGTDLTEWEIEGGGDLMHRGKTISIGGGAGLMPKTGLVTPLGVATEISQDDMDWLQKEGSTQNREFKRLEQLGWLKAVKNAGWRDDPDSVAADMAQRDNSSQVTPNDYVAEKDKENMRVTVAPKIGNDRPISALNTRHLRHPGIAVHNQLGRA